MAAEEDDRNGDVGRVMLAEYKSLPIRQENGKALTLRGESRRSFDEIFAAVGLSEGWHESFLDKR